MKKFRTACLVLAVGVSASVRRANGTGGRDGGNHCPTSDNARGQMAVFITKTFGLH